MCIWVRSRNCGCLVTWFCYQLIAKPGNKTATVSWPDPYFVGHTVFCKLLRPLHLFTVPQNCYQITSTFTQCFRISLWYAVAEGLTPISLTKLTNKTRFVNFLPYQHNHNNILHIPRQHGSIVMCQISSRLNQSSFNYNSDSFRSIWNQ